jgi:phospholipase C
MFLEKRFGITVASISPWHRAVCGDLTSAFNFATPNDAPLPQLPDVSDFAALEAQQKLLPLPVPPSTPQPLFQEPGIRYSRALPYELHTSARVAASGLLTVIFSNTGQQGAVFHVYDKLHLDRIPRRYTLEAGKNLSDVWNTTATDAGQYDLWIYSTNGYLRSFSGSVTVQEVSACAPEIQVCYAPCTDEIYLKVTNHGSKPGAVTVSANAYRSDGPWPLALLPATTASLNWNLEASFGWYDFTVDASGFERRFAGRMETGHDGFSDPARALAHAD